MTGRYACGEVTDSGPISHAEHKFQTFSWKLQLYALPFPFF